MGDGGKGDREGHHTGSSEKYYLERARRYEEARRLGKVGKESEEISKKESENNSKKKDEDCFIASVVYGDVNAREVNVLREYRDNVLMNSQEGRKFVELYYGGLGKILAGFFREQGKFLIPIIRKGLDYVVRDYLEREK